MTRIVTLTLSPTIDISTEVDHVVAERKLRCDDPLMEPGGGGVNVARALRRFGVDPLAVFTTGGHPGARLLELVQEEGVAAHPVPIEGQTRENFTVFESATTLQYRFCMPGPRIRADEWQAILDVLRSLDPVPDFLVASGSLPPGLPEDAYAEVARIAQDSGIRMILDTSGPPLRAAIDAGVFLIKPNLSELAWLEGEYWIEDGDQLRQAATRLVTEHDCEGVVVSLGAGGALAVDRQGMQRIAAPPVRSQSKVGAGDSMVAGIIWGLEQGLSVLQAALLGVAAGAAAVMTPGSDLCSREDTERLHAQMIEHPQPLAPIS
ncbi:hypothetical protein BH23CHL2_BH23CHL2_25090 [soil metagenome]